MEAAARIHYQIVFVLVHVAWLGLVALYLAFAARGMVPLVVAWLMSVWVGIFLPAFYPPATAEQLPASFLLTFPPASLMAGFARILYRRGSNLTRRTAVCFGAGLAVMSLLLAPLFFL